MATRPRGLRRLLEPGKLYMFFSVIFALILLYYYYTGRGGPILLASVMVPFAAFLSALESYIDGGPFRRLGRTLNALIVAAHLLAALAVASYIVVEFEELNTVRFGSYNRVDVAVGSMAFLAVMLFAARRYPAIFLLNLALFLYTLNGRWAPYPFDHPGIRLERVLTAMSVEFETGVFEKLPQLALTLIGAFMLFVAVAHGFGLVESLVRTIVFLFRKRPSFIPQAAVISSMSVAMVSGSGAANAASTGSITIPLMKKSGVPSVKAAAIETAASLGGQLMPPIMGISAFVMADYLGTTYFDVIARGWAPALLYYLGVALAVLIVSRGIRFKGLGGAGAQAAPVGRADIARSLAFLAGIVALVVFLGVRRQYPAYAALQSAILLLIASLVIEAYETRDFKAIARNTLRKLASTIRTFASFTVDITLLLATLGAMTGLITITGIPTRVGFLLLEYGAGSIPLLVGLSFVFGYIVGLGLPPVVTYILTVVVIAPYMIQAGVNPWAIHFYAFFLGVMSELSPPTSVTAAVTSKLAQASFTRTMVEALSFASPLFVLMAAVIMEPGLVLEPGIGQLGAVAKTLVTVVAVTTGLTIQKRTPPWIAARAALIALGLGALFS